ncbi:MAG: NAD-dependent epimerase/dehydratase family protein [Demequinaceae bacterium]|nr:NAD-dependent epimerase/dehydratase family protein [Demequinaceae bacterium]
MRILFIGGTGIISSAVSPLAIERGHDLTLVTRGLSPKATAPEGAEVLTVDAHDTKALRSALRGREFDAVVQWIAYTPDQIADDLETFGGLSGQYVFISSASAYEKPPSHYIVREDRTPLVNPFWEYSRDKIACEEALNTAIADGFPATIVRPSLTYGPSQIPVCVGSWDTPWTIVDRIRRGAPILIPGDGTSLEVLTHHRDFAPGLLGLLGNPAAIGEAFHITSDEALTWNEIYADVAEAAGVDAEAFAAQVLHVPTDALGAADEGLWGPLWGDKSHSIVYDNAKIKALVPDFAPSIPFAEGIRETVAWFESDASRRAIDDDFNTLSDRVAAIYARALREAGDLRA